MPPKASPRSQAPAAPSGGVKNTYLLGYNFVSAALWATVLGKTVLTASNEGLQNGKVYQELEQFTRLTQSLAGLEVLHSLVGIVRAPLLTTLMQVSSRFLLVWGIGYQFPQTTRYNPAYTTMLIAWSITEVIRYSYFVFVLSGSGVPGFLTWLRYNTFLVLYPLGVGSETWLVYKAIPLAEKREEWYGWALWGVLFTYIPGFYTLFTYMLTQRRRIMGGKSKAN